MDDLDNVVEIRKQDPEGMLERIGELPEQLRSAWRAVSGLTLPGGYATMDNVVVLGMGGSAIGGDLVRTLLAGELRVPLEVVRDYELPAFVGPRTLAIASSYSGNTEETLTGFRGARERGAQVVVLTTDGQLLKQAQSEGVPTVVFSYKAQPRAALGHSLVPLLGILRAAGLVGDKGADIEEAASVLEGLRGRLNEKAPTARNPAKQLARELYEHLPIVYGGGLTAEVARRWKGQFNENGKAWATYDVLPELNHNTVVGYEHPASMVEVVRIVFLATDYCHPRIKARFAVTQEILRRRGATFFIVQAEGRSALAQLMSSVYYGDYTSYYLALIYGADPSPVKVIDFLKAELAKA
ncbi:MAG: bifunctional phosphoglucose/phosphomannose isomerase [Chloroflexi bacterium]|nr:bifunctional phosphoglucose/phosphomannose isomerase [Chloroflexota bacterium]MCL5108157.1 bifunctional phosphoglucose/phosphomannose isomerase [Chloroflexota bacterium]